MEDLNVDRDEKVCLDSMFKLKAVVKARGEHKQRIQLNLTISGVKLTDDTTKVISLKKEHTEKELSVSTRCSSPIMRSNEFLSLSLIRVIHEPSDIFTIHPMIDISFGQLRRKNQQQPPF